jgi:hypothetical protein
MDIPVANKYTRLDSNDEGTFILGPTTLDNDSSGFCLSNMLAIDYVSDYSMKLTHMYIKMTNRKVSPGKYEVHLYSKIDDILGKNNSVFTGFNFIIGSRVQCSIKSLKTHTYFATVIDVKNDLYTIVYDDSFIRRNLTKDLLQFSDIPIPEHDALVTEKIIPITFDITKKDIIKYVFDDPIIVEPGQIVGIVNQKGSIDFSWSGSWNNKDALSFNYLYSFDSPKIKGDIQWRVQSSNRTRPGFNINVDFF